MFNVYHFGTFVLPISLGLKKIIWSPHKFVFKIPLCLCFDSISCTPPGDLPSLPHELMDFALHDPLISSLLKA